MEKKNLLTGKYTERNKEATDKQKTDCSKISTYTFIGSSLYFFYLTNWALFLQWKSLVYLTVGIFGSGILLGMFNFYLANLLTLLLLKTIQNPTGETIKKYGTFSILLGIPLLLLGIFIDYQATRIFFNWWY